jgi:hypothetical protein
LRSFKQDYPQASLYLIYGGDKEYFFDDVQVVPMTMLLAKLPDILDGIMTTPNADGH